MPNVTAFRFWRYCAPWGSTCCGPNGFRSIRAGFMAVAHDINRKLGWSGIQTLERA
jgi:hypothetical protein